MAKYLFFNDVSHMSNSSLVSEGQSGREKVAAIVIQTVCGTEVRGGECGDCCLFDAPKGKAPGFRYGTI